MNNSIISIACADDHPFIREGLISFINRFGGMRVDIEASNGRELIDQIEQSKRKPDVCMLDISMPVMDGYDTLPELKRRWPKIKVLVLTIQEMGINVVRMMENGANGYLAKNRPPEELKQAIYSVYNTGIYYSDTVAQQYVMAMHADNTKLRRLTPMEMQVISYIATELSYAEIAKKLGVTTRSVEGHRDSIFRKLNINNRISLAVYAIRHGLVSLDDNMSTT